MKKELKMLEFLNAENARDRILQELDDMGFSSENKEKSRLLGDRIMNIILQECWPHKHKPEACSDDQIFDDFLNDRNPQNEIV